MNIPTTPNIDEVGLVEKVKKWMSGNDDQSEDDSEYEKEIEVMLREYQSDLGGLVAIRGFIYQYYVAIYYMLRMFHKKEVWWHSVIFELMDDVTLIGEDKVRFVQVKTVKETGDAKNFTPRNFYTREGGELKSWLDKLFLNFNQLETVYKRNLVEFDIQDIKDINVEFEIATNNTYGKGLNVYSDNVSFLISDEKKLGELSEKLSIPCRKSGVELHTKVGKEIKWCLSRFHLNHLNRFSELKDQIIYIIKEISEQNSTDVAEHILKHIFYSVIERTENDNVTDKRKFVFTKQEVQEMIHQIKPRAIRDVQDYLREHDIKEDFIQCIEELRRDYQKITSPSKIELLQTLTWIQEEIKEKSEKDIFVYVRILHLLFEMRSSDSEREIKKPDELLALRKSLEIMTFCLTFYIDKEIFLSEVGLITKQVESHEAGKKVFTLFHANDSFYTDEAFKKVNDIIEESPFFQGIHEQFYCLILGSRNRPSFAGRLGVTRVTDDFRETSQSSILKKPNMVKYYDQEFIEAVQDHFYQMSEMGPMSDSLKLDQWHEILDESGQEL